MSLKLRKKKSLPPFLQISKMAPNFAFVRKQVSADLKAGPISMVGAALLP